MEVLGYAIDSPFKKRNGKWDYVTIEYREQEAFNEATSKVLRMFKHPDGDGKCLIADIDDNKYILDVVHVNYDSIANTIHLLPYDCKRVRN